MDLLNYKNVEEKLHFSLFPSGCTARKILHTELRNFNDAKAVCAQNGTTIATVLDGQQIEEAADAAQYV